MQQPDFLKLPCRLERDGHGRETIIGADGAVIFSDGSGDTIEGAAEWLVHCLNTYPKLMTACKAHLAAQQAIYAAQEAIYATPDLKRAAVARAIGQSIIADEQMSAAVDAAEQE